MRTTQAFHDAVTSTLAELVQRGVTVSPDALGDAIERNITAVSQQLGIQPRSAWRYFDPAALADSIAPQSRTAAAAGPPLGQPPMPPLDNPDLALILGSVPQALIESGGDLHQVFLNVAVNAWMGGHIHGEDGCTGCDRGAQPGGHNWTQRMASVAAAAPDATQQFNPAVWNAALARTGYRLVRTQGDARDDAP